MTTIMPWEHADPLTEALYQVRMRGAFYSWTEASGPGSVEMPQLPDTLTFHIVARGTAYLEVDGEDAVALPAGRARAGASGDRPSRVHGAARAAARACRSAAADDARRVVLDPAARPSGR